MIVDRTRWLEYFDGYFVDGCAVKDAQRLFFLMQPDVDQDADPLPPARLLYARADRPVDQKRFVRGHVDFVPAGLAFAPHSDAFVIVGNRGEVFSYDGSSGNNEPDLPTTITGSDLRAAVHGLGRVGRTLYVVGWPRRVWRRRSGGGWDQLSAGLPAAEHLGPSDDVTKALFAQRLRAVAGFSDDDLYVAGDAGEIWRWDGSLWRRQAVLKADALVAACAADDRIFIADATGALWSGRGERWTRVTEASPYPIADLAWFGGRLWCGMQNGALDRLDGARLTSADAPSEVSPGIQHLDVAPDGSCLVAAGRWGAALHDGTRWRTLFGATAPA